MYVHVVRLLFTNSTALFAANGFRCGESRAGIEPTNDNAPGGERARLCGEVDENHLSDIVRQVSVTVGES